MADKQLRPIRSEPLVVVLMGIASLIVIALSIQMGGNSSRLPLAVGILMAVCSVLYGLIGPTANARKSIVISNPEWVFGAMVLLMLAITPFIGFLAASWLFVFALYAYRVWLGTSQFTLRSALGAAFVATVVFALVYLVFVLILRIHLP